MCRSCQPTCIDEGLRGFFGWLGYQVGSRPGYFIIVPILLTALCASGFQRITYEADPEYLFSPIDGEAKFERAQLEKHFPMNYSAFDPGRISKHPRFGRLLLRAADNGSVLRTQVFQQVITGKTAQRPLFCFGETTQIVPFRSCMLTIWCKTCLLPATATATDFKICVHTS